ncbi:MAG TPA: DMT family transporter [Burkholderiaceae bacterium]|nr:DMT family transporter [Burkholderiaceae bacterium]
MAETRTGTSTTARLRRGMRGARVRARAVRMHLSGLTPTRRGILWALAAGLAFQVANTAMRALSLALHPLEAQFLRYFFGLLPLVPMVVAAGSVRRLWPDSMQGQLWRAALHTLGLVLWFIALPHMPLADMTAISFTNPLFVLIGAAWLLKEPMDPARWIAVAVGFAGVMVIVGPGLSSTGGWYSLLMLASAAVFAASFLLTKVLTRRDSAASIVLWQTLLITAMSLPIALPFWTWPSPAQWGLAVLGGLAGTAGHYALTRSFAAADISATQSVKFVDLLWAALIGWIVFDDTLRPTTLLGGAVILASIVALDRYERRKSPRTEPLPTHRP